MKKNKEKKIRGKLKKYWKKIAAIGTAIILGTAGLILLPNDGNPPPGEDIEAYIWIPATGYGSMPHWEVNKTYVKQFLKDNMKWRLQASNNEVDWYDANSLLDVGLNWVDTNLSYKVTLTLNTTLAPKELFYRFDLACNRSLKQYAEIDGYEWILTVPANATENYTLFFNWSDIKDLVSSGKVTLDKGVKDNFFWFRIQSVNKIPVGTVFVIDPSYGVIADSAIDSFEWDAQEGWVLAPENILIKLNNSEYYMTCAGSGDGTADYDGYLNTFQISNSNGSFTTKTIKSQWEYDTSDGLYAGVIPLENVNDTYIVYYKDAAAGVIFTTRAFANDGTLQKTQIATRSYTLPHTSQMLHVTGDVYALIYQEGGGGYDYFLETYNIWSNGTISSRIDFVEWDQTSTADARDWHPQAVMVDIDTISIVWCESVGSDGWITTFNISSAGDITNTAADVWEFNNEFAKFPYLINISGDVFAIAYQDASGDGKINTTIIYDTGMMSKTWIDSLEFDAADCVFPNVFIVNDASDFTVGVYGITYQGTGADGFVCTLNISSDGTVGDSIIDSLEFDAADSVYYCNAVHVSDNYYLLVYTGTNSDGWAKTVYITTGGADYYLEYLTSGSGNWTVPENVYKITVLVVGAGGGSGSNNADQYIDAGGGGGGGLIFIENITTIGEVAINPGNNISYSIGTGGDGADSTSTWGGNGNDTTFGNLTAKGGGGGGSGTIGGQWKNGLDGGSGGGGGSTSVVGGTGGSGTQPSQDGWSGIYGYGTNGGTATAGNGAGGGGANNSGFASNAGGGGDGDDYSSVFGMFYANGNFSGGGDCQTLGGDYMDNSGYGAVAYASTITGSFDGENGIICIRYSLEILGNTAPVQSGESPTNNSVSISITPTLYVLCSDSDLDTMNATWSSNSSGSWQVFGSNYSLSSGSNISQININFSEYNMKYWWNVSLSDGMGNWDNETYSFTTEAISIEGYIWNLTIRNNGKDYFVWLGSNTSAYNVSAQIDNFDETTEYIGIQGNDTWSKTNASWIHYHYADQSGTNFSVTTFDVIEVYLTDAGTQVISMYENESWNYTNSKTYTLVNNTKNKGYNYTSYNHMSDTTLSAINTSIGLETGEFIGLWNKTSYTWVIYNSDIGITDDNVEQWDIIISKVEDSTAPYEVWNT